MRRVVEIVAMLAVAAFLAIAISGPHPDVGPEREDAARHALREHIVANGVEDTGATNLVTAIYLGYRAFDTLGETIVLLLAASGVVLMVERHR